MKQKLRISFSGGRTSAFMTKWMLENLKDKYEMIVCFANTGKEREETLEFVDKCDKEFGFNVIWIEAIADDRYIETPNFKIVNFETASRNGEPFEWLISNGGLVNQNRPKCTNILKTIPLNKYTKSLGWKKYYTALGIRSDEPKRLNREKAKKERLIYFADVLNVTKSDINLFWSKQSFDLKLKSYEGNCDLCFKKGLRKLMTITKENPHLADWWREMENKYENFTPERYKHNEKLVGPVRFYRDNMTIDDIIEESSFPFDMARDESNDIDNYRQMMMWDNYLDSNGGCSESCEVY
jgi:3'-phosphoadenosine 5'-phosphosulfate sulfotransferase (PAPS reductase)/FAD synthetase